LFAITSGSEIAVKSVHLLLFTWISIGNGGSRRSASSAVRRQLSDTASRLVEVVVEVNVTAVDWLAIFSDYRVSTKLWESWCRKISFQNSDTTFLRQSYDIVTCWFTRKIRQSCD